MPKPAKLFNPNDYTATKFASAEDKAAFGDALVHFIVSGFVKTLFTQKLYDRLSSTFGFIAHYDKHGFWDEYFEDTESRLRFLVQLAKAPCYGSPAFTFSDLERSVKEYILRSGYVPAYEAKLRREKESAERITLAVLQARYGVSDSVQAADEHFAATHDPEIVYTAGDSYRQPPVPAAVAIQGSLFG